jgi:hypothetical protein
VPNILRAGGGGALESMRERRYLVVVKSNEN